MPRFNFNEITLRSKADISKIQENFTKLEELGITSDEVDTLINALSTQLTNLINNSAAAKVSKSGDTMSGNLSMGNNKINFTNTGNIEWKETGYGDKFRVISDFNRYWKFK